MFKRMRFAQVAVAGVLLLAAGCSSPLPWERDWGQSTSLARVFGQERSPATALASQGSTFPSSPMPTPGGTPAANPVSAATQSVSKAFKSAGDKVASALDVKPKVIPASDPAKLSSRPERLTPALYVQAAQLSENQGALAAAKQQYEKALELDPRDVHTLIAVALPRSPGPSGRGPAAVPSGARLGSDEHPGVERSRLASRPPWKP